MQLRSSAFREGAPIPAQFTADGNDHSPPLSWSGAPAAARSFALVCRDPDAPAGTWYHWAAFDIPAGTELLAGHVKPESPSLRQAYNDFGRLGYGGPAPPRGHGRHRYIFTIYALSVERLDLPARTRCADVEHAARHHAIASAELTGTYSR